MNLLFKMTTPNHIDLIWNNCSRWEQLNHNAITQIYPKEIHLQSYHQLDTSTLQPHFIASQQEATEEKTTRGKPKSNTYSTDEKRTPLKQGEEELNWNHLQPKTHNLHLLLTRPPHHCYTVAKSKATITNSKIQEKLTGFNPSQRIAKPPKTSWRHNHYIRTETPRLGLLPR